MKDYHCGSTSRGVDTVQVLINDHDGDVDVDDDDEDDADDVNDAGDDENADDYEAEAEGNDDADDLCRRTSTLARAGINTGVTGEPLLTGNSPNI